MSLDDRTSALIGRIYCAGQDAEEWDRVAEELIKMTDARLALTTLVDLRHKEYSRLKLFAPETSRVAKGFDEYQQGVFQIDPTLTWASAHPNAGFCDSGEVVLEPDYMTNEFVRWNDAHFGASHLYVGYSPPEDGLTFSFSLHTAGPVAPREKKLIRMVFGHMQCAMRMTRRPILIESNAAVLVLDRSGTVTQANDKAREILRLGDGLSLSDGRLEARVAHERSGLNRALASVSHATITGDTPAALMVTRPSGKPPWLLSIRPSLSNYGPLIGARCELIVRVSDTSPAVRSLALVQTIFALTRRETDVLELLVGGQTLDELSDSLGISLNTAKVHLASIFRKTDKHRQTELVRICTQLEQ